MCGKASTACTRKVINIEGEDLEERRMEGRREEERRKVVGEVKGIYGGRLEGMSGEAREVKIFVAIAPVHVRGW